MEPDSTEASAAAKKEHDDTQTATSRSQPELIRPATTSTTGNRNPELGAASAHLPAPAPTDTRKPAAEGVVSPSPRGEDIPASGPSPEQPRRLSFFQTGFGQMIGIVGAVFLGVAIHLIALALILRRYSAHLARLSRLELVTPTTDSLVEEGAAAGAQTAAAAASATAPAEVMQISTAEAFDIGPTYEEEMRQKQQAQNQQEEALLRHIFALNMQMREHLGQLGSGAA